jgi:hypothetical protein
LDTVELTRWVFMAAVLPAPPEPEFAPPAASTVPVVADVVLSPTWPVAVAEPVVDAAVPLFVTVLVLVLLEVTPELLPAPSAPPLVALPPPLLVMVVWAVVPVAEALPLEALALLVVELLTFWLFFAVVLPEVPEPLLAPPAAFTFPTLTEVLLLPFWPVAEPEPDVAEAVPLLVTLVVLVLVVVAELLPPLLDPPVVVLPLPVLLTVVDDLVPVELTLPLDPLPLELLDEVAELELLAVVPSARAVPLTSTAMVAAAAPARSAVFFLERGPAPVSGGTRLGVF